tara:strand:- start:1458 stop:3545 length:2088 start_codon:yes stop_codon:yes gene_type:complete
MAQVTKTVIPDEIQMNVNPRDTIFSRRQEIHHMDEALSEQNDNIEDKKGNKQLIGLSKDDGGVYFFTGDEIGFNHEDRNNFAYTDRVRKRSKENGKFNSGGIASNLFLANDQIPENKLTHPPFVLDGEYNPYHSIIITHDQLVNKYYTFEAKWHEWFMDENDGLSQYTPKWKLSSPEEISRFNSYKKKYRNQLNLNTVMIYQKKYTTFEHLKIDLENSVNKLRLTLFDRINKGFEIWVDIPQKNGIYKLTSIDIMKMQYIEDKKFFPGDNETQIQYFHAVKNVRLVCFDVYKDIKGKRFILHMKEVEKDQRSDAYLSRMFTSKTNRRRQFADIKNKEDIDDIKREIETKVYMKSFEFNAYFKPSACSSDYENSLKEADIESQDRLFIKRGTRLIGNPRTNTTIHNITGIYRSNLHILINFNLNCPLNIHGNKSLFNIDNGCSDKQDDICIKALYTKCSNIMKDYVESKSKVYPKTHSVPENKVNKGIHIPEVKNEVIDEREVKDESESDEGIEYEDDEEEYEDEGDEEEYEDEGDEGVPTKAPCTNDPKRKPFNETTKRIAEEKKPRDEIIGMSFKSRNGVVFHDYDHKNGDNTNNSQENCNVMSIFSHRIKTTNPNYYDDLLTSKIERLELQCYFILDIFENMHKDDKSHLMTLQIESVDKDDQVQILARLIESIDKDKQVQLMNRLNDIHNRT